MTSQRSLKSPQVPPNPSLTERLCDETSQLVARLEATSKALGHRSQEAREISDELRNVIHEVLQALDGVGGR